MRKREIPETLKRAVRQLLFLEVRPESPGWVEGDQAALQPGRRPTARACPELSQKEGADGRAHDIGEGGFPAGPLDDLSIGQSSCEQELAALRAEVARLGREQSRAITLLEGRDAALDDVASTWEEHLAELQREARGMRQALHTLEGRFIREVVQQLLPVADALRHSVDAAERLQGEARDGKIPPAGLAVGGWLRGLPLVEQRLLALLEYLGAGPVSTTGTAQYPQAKRQDSRGPDHAAFDGWLQGLRLVEQRLLATLEHLGAQPIPTVGCLFDPRLHLAVDTVANPEIAEAIVVGEELRGYTLGQQVLRHAEVVVARRNMSAKATTKHEENGHEHHHRH